MASNEIGSICNELGSSVQHTRVNKAADGVSVHSRLFYKVLGIWTVFQLLLVGYYSAGEAVFLYIFQANIIQDNKPTHQTFILERVSGGGGVVTLKLNTAFESFLIDDQSINGNIYWMFILIIKIGDLLRYLLKCKLLLLFWLNLVLSATHVDLRPQTEEVLLPQSPSIWGFLPEQSWSDSTVRQFGVPPKIMTVGMCIVECLGNSSYWVPKCVILNALLTSSEHPNMSVSH